MIDLLREQEKASFPSRESSSSGWCRSSVSFTVTATLQVTDHFGNQTNVSASWSAPLCPNPRIGLFVSNNPVNLWDPLGLWTFEAGLTGAVGLAIIGGGFEVGIVFDSDGGLGLKGTLTGRVGPQLGVDISPYAAGSSACEIDDLNGLSLGAFVDAWKVGSTSAEFAAGDSEFTREPKVQMPIVSGQYSNFGPLFLVGAGGQVSTTGVWRWK